MTFVHHLYPKQQIGLIATRPLIVTIIIAIIACLILLGHQTLGVIDRDEARFAQASKQMLHSGDLITPRFMDELRAKKPIAIYWMQSASAALLGAENIAAYRLPSLVGLLLSLILIWHFSQKLWPAPAPPLQAALTVFLLISSPLIMAEAHLAKTDSILLACIIAQQYNFWQIYRTRDDAVPKKHVYLFWIFMGGGILIKGPIAPLIALTTLISLIIMDKPYGKFGREFGRGLGQWLGKFCFFRGFVILTLITSPWAIAVSLATEGAFLKTAIYGDFLAKIQSGQESHGAPPGTYLGVLGIVFWPAIAFGGFLFWAGRNLWREQTSRFCLAWIIGYWIVIEMVPTKLPHYILPLLPPLALLIAHALITPLPPASKRQHLISDLFYGFSALWGIGLCGVCFWLVLQFGGETRLYGFIAATILSGLVGIILWQIWAWRQTRQLSPLIIILLAGILVQNLLFAGLTAHLSHIHISQRLKAQIHNLNDKPALITLVGYHEPSAVFHLGQDIFLLDSHAAALFMAEAPDGLAIIEEKTKLEFLNATKNLNLTLKQKAELTGFNIAKGQNITLYFYQHDAH